MVVEDISTSIPRDLGEEAAAQKALMDAQNMFPKGSTKARKRHVSVCSVRAPKVSKPSTTKTQQTKVHRVFFSTTSKTPKSLDATEGFTLSIFNI